MKLGLVLAIVCSSAAGAAAAQVRVLEDSLRGSTSGVQHGGELSAAGWRVTGAADYVYWHVPTLGHGAAEFSVTGLRAREDRAGIDDKAELFHMYDHTFENADTNYIGYRNNPFKHFIRKTGVLDTRPGRTDSLELVWVIGPNYIEPDSPVLSWDPAVTYHFREEWGPDGAGNTEIRTYRDGTLVMTMSEPGEWAPAGHSIRMGVARLTEDSGAPLDAVFSDLEVWDLAAVGPPPELEPAPHDALPSGPVRVVGNSLVDDHGAFLGLGATYMTALWQAKHNRALLESDLALFRAHGFNYIRALGQVGGDYWAGLEIAPVDQRNEDGTFVAAWADYVQQLQGLLDVVYAHGMRTELTIFGGASNIEGGSIARQTAVDLVLAAVAGREEKVILLEVANEGWQTGFPDAGGLEEMRNFAEYLASNTSIPVAITSNHGINTITETYAGSSADIATWHVSRDLGVDEGWGPVWDPWELENAPGVPPVSSNEPIGPGSSVASEERPIHLVMAAAFAYTAKLPMYVFHSSAGVRHVARFEDMAGLREFAHVRRLLPGDLANWTRNDGEEAAAPFTALAGGCVRNIGARKRDRFVAVPIGIRPGGLTLEAREAIAFQVYEPLSGSLVGEHQLAAGERITLAQGSGAYILTNVSMQAPLPHNDAAFVRQEVPEVMEPGRAYAVSVTMRNTGAAAWSFGGGYKLGSEGPRDNVLFDDGRQDLGVDETVAPGAERTFAFAVTAPAEPGSYVFQRRMLREGVEWFGEFSPAVTVRVQRAPAASGPDAGVPDVMQPTQMEMEMMQPEPGAGGPVDAGCGCAARPRPRGGEGLNAWWWLVVLTSSRRVFKVRGVWPVRR